MKYTKVNIVESKYPPTNKNDWWFDLNEQKLKRFKEGEWALYNYTWPKMPYVLADNEILISMLDIEDLGGPGMSDIKSDFSKWGTVKEVKRVYDEMTNRNVYHVIFAEALTTLNVSQSVNLFDESIASIELYLPASLTTITTSVSLFTTSSEGKIIIYFTNLQSFSGPLYNYAETPDVYIYSRQVPQIGTNFLYGTGEASIYVPKEMVSQYKQSTNWSQYNIVAID